MSEVNVIHIISKPFHCILIELQFQCVIPFKPEKPLQHWRKDERRYKKIILISDMLEMVDTEKQNLICIVLKSFDLFSEKQFAGYYLLKGITSYTNQP